MRPVRLVMQGFGAYRDRTEVDFEGVDLFAFTGPTGAGKSTVVDAICMALYGAIPRYDDLRLIAPAISQGLTEALVSLDFVVDGEAYTAVRVVKRTKTGASTREARLERGGEVLAGNEKELTQRVTELLGLSFEHFTRCVVLPQGQFAKFLHDKPRDRQELLKRLLDLGIYDRVATAARARATDAKARATADQNRLGDLADVTPERRASLAAAAAAARALYAEVKAEEESLALLAGRVAECRRAAGAAMDEAARLDTLAVPDEVGLLALRQEQVSAESVAATQEAAETRAAVAAAETGRCALGPLAPLLEARAAHDRLGALVDATPQRRAEAQARRDSLATLRDEVRDEEGALAGAVAEVDDTLAAAQRASEASIRLGAVEVPADVGAVAAARDRAAADLATADARVGAAAAALAEAEARAREAGDVGPLLLVQRAFAARARFTEEVARLEADRSAAEADLARARADEDEARRVWERAAAELEAATVRHQAHALRQHLVAGEPCPVCTQPVRSLPPVDVPVELADAAEQARARQDALRAAERATVTAESRCREIDGSISGVRARAAEMEREFAGFTSAADVDTRLREVESAAAAVGVARTAHTAALDEAAARRDEREAARVAERRARDALTAVLASLSAWSPPAPAGGDLVADWDVLAAWARTQSDAQAALARAAEEQVATGRAALTQRRAALSGRVTDAGVTVEADRSAAEAVAAALAATDAAIERIDEQLAERARLDAALGELARTHPLGRADAASVTARIEAIEAAEGVLAAARRRDAEATERVEAARAAEAAVTREVADLRQAFLAVYASVAPLGAPAPAGTDLAGDWDTLVTWSSVASRTRTAVAEEQAKEAARLEDEVESRRRALADRCAAAGVVATADRSLTEAAHAALHAADHALARCDEDLAAVAALRASYQAAKDEEAVALHLAQLLRADQFEKWLLDDVMNQLVVGATGRLMELSGGQFSLAYEDGEFMVVDHRNADQTRQAKTLSGGETFLASLSLALSLADQLAVFASGRAVTLDALFLDEGFGTLDADTLDVVASAIEELGSRGRMVGIISHVPELAERVPVRFEVRKIANASHIEKVWQ